MSMVKFSSYVFYDEYILKAILESRFTEITQKWLSLILATALLHPLSLVLK